MYIQKTLSNGIRIAAEQIPYVHSVSLGVWVGNGSRHEKASENGISHFIEHMVFKGTHKRSAKQIALEMDSVGGQLNAFTTREYTCFYAKTLNEYVETSIDILSDMIFSPLLSESDMDLERRVVFEEIAMYEDSPEDISYDLFFKAVWNDTPLGRTILGTKETLDAITPDIMRQYMKTHYTSKNIVLAVAGNFDDTLFELLEKYFGSVKLSNDEILCESATYSANNIFLPKDFEQAQLIAGFNGIDIYDDSVYAMLIFNNLFGGSMSSRLFQNIREKYGLVYSVGAGNTPFIGTGAFDISAATSPENVHKVSELIVKEVKAIKENKLTDDEIERSKIQLKGNYMISGENVGTKMQTLGRATLLNKPILSQEETIKKIMSVSKNDVSEIIERVLDISTLSVAAVGPIDNIDGLFAF